MNGNWKIVIVGESVDIIDSSTNAIKQNFDLDIQIVNYSLFDKQQTIEYDLVLYILDSTEALNDEILNLFAKNPKTQFIFLVRAYSDTIMDKLISHGFHYIIKSHQTESLVRTVSRVLNIESQVLAYHNESKNYLLHSNTYLQTIFDTSKTGYILIDTDLNVLSFNKMTKVIGNKNHENLGKEYKLNSNILEYFPSERHSVIRENFEKVFNGEMIEYEVAYPRLDGNIDWYQVSLVPINYENSKGSGLLLAMTEITEQKLTQIELFKTQENLDIILESSETAFILLDEDLRVITFNKIAQDKVYDNLNPLNKLEANDSIYQHFSKEKLPYIESHFNKVLNGDTVEYEISIPGKNSPIEWYLVKITPIKKNDSHKNGLLLSLIEITEAKLIDLKIRESEINLRAIFNATNRGYILMDRDLRLMSFNELAIEYSKLSMGPAFKELKIGEFVYDYIPVERKEDVIFKMKNVISSGFGIDYEVELHVENHSSFYFIRILPILTDDKIVKNLVLAVTEITKEKLAESELVRSEAQLRSIFDSTDIGYILLDSSTRYISNNKIAEKYLQDLNIHLDLVKLNSNMVLLEVLDEDRKKWLQNTVQEISENKQVEIEFFSSQSKSPKWFLIKFIPIFSQQNDLINIMVSLLDITESKNINKEILETKLSLEKAQKLAHIGSWDFNFENNHLVWSDELFKIFEIEDRDMESLYAKYRGRFHPNDLPILDKSIASGIDFEFENRIILDDKSIKYILNIGEFKKNEKGKIIGLTGTAQDISIQKNKDLELFKNQEQLLYKSQLLAASSEITRELLFTKDLHLSLQKSIEIVGKAFNAGGAYFFECEGPRFKVIKTINWLSPENKFPIYTDALLGYPFDKFDEMFIQINRKKPFVFYTRDIENQDVSQFLLQNNLESVFVLPIFMKESFFGLIGFVDLQKMRTWTADEIAILNSMVTNISSAIEKISYQKKIEESEINFRQITETINDVFWLYDTIQNKYVYISPNCEQVLFANQNYFYEVGNYVDDYLNDEAKLIFKDFRKEIEINGIFNAEYKVISHKGIEHWIQEKSFAIKNEKGEVIRISGISVDKTEKYKIDAELRQLSMVAQKITNGVLIRDNKGGIIYANQAYLDMFELSSVKEMNKKPYHLTYLYNSLYATQEWKDGTQFTTEVEAKTTQGQKKYLIIYNNPIFDNKDSLLQQITIITDITERVKARKQTEKIAERLNLILNSLDESVWAVSYPEQYPLFMSNSFEKITGYKTSDWMKNPRIWQEILIPEDKNRLKDFFDKLNTDESINEIFKIVDKDQIERWVDITLKKVYNENQQPYMLLGTALNITDRVIAQKQVVDSLKAAEIANRAINELELKTLQLQMNPHFIFNALNSIQSYVMHQDHFLANAYLSKFAKLIRLFLDSSRSRYITLQDEIVLLTLYIELEKLRFEDKFDFEISCDPSISTYIEIPTMILQPFVENAINHGLRYKESKGWLKVKFYKENDVMCCSIQDNGVGREKAKSIQKNTQKGYRSQGLKITMERLITYNKINNSNLQFIVNDLVEAKGDRDKDLGTEMIITFADY